MKIYNKLDLFKEKIQKTNLEKYGVKTHRYNFRKDVLIKQGYDKIKTEFEIMLNRKIYKIYNAGNLKYQYLVEGLLKTYPIPATISARCTTFST